LLVCNNPGVPNVKNGENNPELVGDDACKKAQEMISDFEKNHTLLETDVDYLFNIWESYFVSSKVHSFWTPPEIVFNHFNVSFFPEKIKKGFNAAIGTDILHWTTIVKISKRELLPYTKDFIQTSSIESDLKEMFHTLDILVIGVDDKKLATLFPTLAIQFDISIQDTFFHEGEIIVVKYGWNKWKGFKRILVVWSIANPFIFGHLSSDEKTQVGLKIKRLWRKRK